MGRLQVSLRSQSPSLILHTSRFFQLWTRIETDFGNAPDCVIEDGRYTRRLRLLPGDLSHEDQGKVIALYIHMLDNALKAFFSSIDDPAKAAENIQEIYLSANIRI